MIHIDLSGFTPQKDNWLTKANSFTTALITKTIIERKSYIDSKQGFWGQIKDELLNLPNARKCWFSEEVVGGFEYHIEHFRPKKEVVKSDFNEENRVGWSANSKSTIGYWWLSFDYRNYRICGQTINSSFKKNYFPLRVGSFIAYSHDDTFTNEEPILLDPAKQGDPELLTFTPDGKVYPSVNDDTSHDFFRADVSIKIYGLNNIPPLVQLRKIKWEECEKAIRRANIKYEQIQNTNDDLLCIKYTEEFMDFINNDIKPSINPSSCFSAVAKTCVLDFAGKYTWINDYVLN